MLSRVMADKVRLIGLPLIYLIFAVPVLIALCFITQPLHSVDEPAHFLRTAQIANGDLFPVLGPDQHSTGSYQSAGVNTFSSFYGKHFGAYMHQRSRASIRELERLSEIRAGDRKIYVEHSNTTIYFPLAYVVPSAAVFLAKAFTDRPLVWMYIGRLINALAGVTLTYIVLSRATRCRLLFFVVSLLPITLFQTAALSADSLLIPSAMAFAVVLTRVIEGRRFSWRENSLTAIIMAFVALGKIAYMPLVALPPIAAWLVRRKLDRTVVGLGLAALSVSALWMAWSLAVHDLVFTVRQTNFADQIDVQKQLVLIANHPTVFLRALLGTMTPSNISRYLASFSGGIIGWLDVRLPIPLMAVNFIALAGASLVDGDRQAPKGLRPIVAATVAGSAVAIFLLLYLQWNAVGAKDIVGVQGRYFLPLLPVAAVIIPAVRARPRLERLAPSFAVAWGFLSVVVTVSLVGARYWGPS